MSSINVPRILSCGLCAAVLGAPALAADAPAPQTPEERASPAETAAAEEAPGTADPSGLPPDAFDLPTMIPRDPDIGVLSLPDREERQSQEMEETGVPAVSFRFTDRLPESGIEFVHHIVDDAGRHYKSVHYDHGNGLAVADVDGDGLPDLYFTTQLGRNELWRNRGDGTFEDVTDKAGVALAEKVSVTASFADLDNDGDPDLYVTTVRDGNHLFENLGEGRFRDVTEDSGLGHRGHSSGAVFFDYDRDGDLDLYLTNVGVYTTDEKGRGDYWIGLEDAFSGHRFPERFESSLLFENRGDLRFVDVTEERGLVDTGWTGDAAFADLNRDGWPDLYVPNMQGDDHYYENEEGERFEEVTDEYFPKTPWGTMGVDFFDSDGDGRLDLILTDMHSDMSEEIGPERERLKSRMQWSDEHLQGGDDNIFGNALYRQTEDGDFEEVSDEAGVETYWPWGVSTGDVDADGSLDVFITNSMNFPWRYQPNALLINDGTGTFHDRTFPLGVEPRRDDETHAPWFVMDCSGADRQRMHCQGRQGRYLILGTRGSRSSAFVDLEGDGDLDLVTNEFNTEPQVLVSDLAQRHEVRSLKVELTGTESNRDGLGARVELQAGDDVYTRYHDGKSGYLSQSSLPLYFGLGEHETVDEVTVEWPSGIQQTVPGPIESGTTLEVVEERPETGGAEAAEGDGNARNRR
ncbi:MAG: CRTAC1 family protein [Acidobacteriota bacterium]